MNRYPELRPGKDRLKRIYITILLWIVGRAIQAAASFIPEIKKEFEEAGDPFALCLEVLAHGPSMMLVKTEKGKIRYVGSKKKDISTTIDLKVKSMDTAFKIFTFQESTATAMARERFIVDGDLPQAMAFVRVLNTIEVLLLPRIIAALAVKRYPGWGEMNPLSKWKNRLVVYLRVFTIG